MRRPGTRRTVRSDADGLPPAEPRRRGRLGAGRREVVTERRTDGAGAGAGVAGGAGDGLLLFARLIRFVVGLIVTVIVVAILLRVLGANQSNDLVSFFTDLGRSLVGPFDGIFTIDNPKTEIAVNWGLAAVAWAVVGGFVAGLVARAGLAGTARRGV